MHVQLNYPTVAMVAAHWHGMSTLQQILQAQIRFIIVALAAAVILAGVLMMIAIGPHGGESSGKVIRAGRFDVTYVWTSCAF